MPAYYGTSIPDWSPSSTINLNWLAVQGVILETGENRTCLCFKLQPLPDTENQGLAKGVILVNLTVTQGWITNQTNIISVFAFHYSFLLNKGLITSCTKASSLLLLYRGMWYACMSQVKWMRIVDSLAFSMLESA